MCWGNLPRIPGLRWGDTRKCSSTFVRAELIDAYAKARVIKHLSRWAVWDTAVTTAERGARRADHFALAIVVRVWEFSFAAEDALAVTEGVATRTHALPAYAGAVRSTSVAAQATVGNVGSEVAAYASTIGLSLRASTHPALAGLPSRAGVAARATVGQGVQRRACATTTALARRAPAVLAAHLRILETCSRRGAITQGASLTKFNSGTVYLGVTRKIV